MIQLFKNLENKSVLNTEDAKSRESDAMTGTRLSKESVAPLPVLDFDQMPLLLPTNVYDSRSAENVSHSQRRIVSVPDSFRHGNGQGYSSRWRVRNPQADSSGLNLEEQVIPRSRSNEAGSKFKLTSQHPHSQLESSRVNSTRSVSSGISTASYESRTSKVSTTSTRSYASTNSTLCTKSNPETLARTAFPEYTSALGKKHSKIDTKPISNQSNHTANSPIPNGASITTQLSLLSNSLHSERSVRQYRSGSGSFEDNRRCKSMILDTGVPPEVPKHWATVNHKSTNLSTLRRRSTSQHVSQTTNTENTNIDERGRSDHKKSVDIVTRRRRCISMPPIDQPHDDDKGISTDIYTRKCLTSVPSLGRCDSSSSDGSSVGPPSPMMPHFALQGYNEGETKLRVVNGDENELEEFLNRKERSKKYFVKSKAQIAEEVERVRVRYARYGHVFEGKY
ncbi:hypothetical protein DASB73_007050 [Starmerella bacillaris]|uniref:Uncharacterized protein n=1 Tax=Starmerella bacillaris TaxID=1247836 RepID=A0AAV5RFJ5_STABA|nr:hypothetical protein DASB73_007050 [Starmerella bacillaris]